MFLILILLLILLILAVFMFAGVCAGGAGFIVLFGDVIVCIVFIALLIRFIYKQVKKKK